MDHRSSGAVDKQTRRASWKCGEMVTVSLRQQAVEFLARACGIAGGLATRTITFG